jgi:photosystem II protein PsbQ
MVRQRSIFSLIFVLLATFLIGCGGPSVATLPPSYTAAEVAKIQEYAPGIKAVIDRQGELKSLISEGEWIKVGNFIHGPMTEAKLNMTYIVPNLAQQNQGKARQIIKDLLKDLVKIDQSATVGNTSQALSNYKQAFADIDKFLELVPEKSS